MSSPPSGKTPAPDDTPEEGQDEVETTPLTETTDDKDDNSPADGYRSEFTYVTDGEGLSRAVEVVTASHRVGVDVETYGDRKGDATDVQRAKIRLIQIACQTPDGVETFVVDTARVNAAPLLDVLPGREVVVHNAGFDLGILSRVGMEHPDKVVDLMLMSSLLTARSKPPAGGQRLGVEDSNKLGDCAVRYLGVSLDKDNQKADFSVPTLTVRQLQYAADDAAILLPLAEKIREELRGARLGKVADLELRCQNAVLWMSRNGVAFDRDAWLAAWEEAKREAEEARQALDAAAPLRPVDAKDGAWDFTKHPHCKDALRALGLPHGSTAVKALREIAHPFAQALLAYKTCRGAAHKAPLLREVETLAPPRPVPDRLARWNWRSNPQILEALRLAGVVAESTRDETLAAIDHPLADALRRYRGPDQRVKSFGPAWTDRLCPDGRMRPVWKQTGSSAGRMSCDSPNMQQIPRDARYRACVRALEGRVLVWADYSQIELRLAAQISGDEKMLAAYREGKDLHTLTAAALTGKDPSDVTKAERQLAKAINFGNLYGSGAARLRQQALKDYGVEITLEEAQRHQDVFRKTYPQLRAWQVRQSRSGTPVPGLKTPGGYPVRMTDTRTMLGRRRRCVHQATEKLNSPVQGSGADGLKLALAALWERRNLCPIAFPVLAVHDEIVVETDDDPEAVEDTKRWLVRAMKDGMGGVLTDCPVEVEVNWGKVWGK